MSWEFALSQFRGRITKTYIVRCCTCAGWYQCTHKRTRSSFVKYIRATGWKRCKLGGWTCSNCFKTLNRRRAKKKETP